MESCLFEKEVLRPILKSIQTMSDNKAFYINNMYYTYNYLGHCISKIRNAICKNANEINCYGLAIHDDIETYSAIIALWMEGKSYVPLHPNQPIERNMNIIQLVGLTNIIDSNENSVFEGSIVNVIDSRKLEEVELELDNWKQVSEHDLAYILFTSGSTGVPKGVQISRQNLGAFMESFWDTGIKVEETDRCLQIFDLTFDVSVQSYLVALIRGACVYTVPYGEVKYLNAAALINEHKITFGAMAPSMLMYLRPYFNEIDASSLKVCILTAEACPVKLMEEWFECAKNVDLYDFYGPTEATIYCTYYKLSRKVENLSLNGIISIGKPMKNVETIIIDEAYNILDANEKGELCVSGLQVTEGYWNNLEKNSTSFFDINIDGIVKRFYHTGDLCYMRDDGNIMYSGRIDQQAKIQGFRVELGEIEHYAREYYAREFRTIAIAFENNSGLTEIALFIEGVQQAVDDLLIFLRSKMPSYMIPSKILFIEKFPLNKSEKIDRNELKQAIIK